MPLNVNQLLTYVLVFAVLYITYEAYTLKNRISCTYRRADRTKQQKWAKRGKDDTWDDVEFEGGLYHVEPDRTVLRWKLVLGIIPMAYRELDFRHDSARALHPDTFDNSYSPSDRKILNIRDDAKGFVEGNRQAVTGKMKKGMLDSLLPFIIIGGFLIVGYLVYRQQSSINLLGKGQNYIEQQIGIINGKLK